MTPTRGWTWVGGRRGALPSDRAPLWPAVSATALLAALALALLPSRPLVPVLALAALGVLVGLVQTVPPAARLVLRRRVLLAVPVLGALVAAWAAAGVVVAARPWPYPAASPSPLRSGAPISLIYGALLERVTPSGWPWQLGRGSAPALLLAVLCAGLGFLLLADVARVQVGLARPPRSFWRALTATPTRRGRIALRAVPGVGLTVVATLLGLALMSTYGIAHPIKATVGTAAIWCAAAVLIVSPLAVGSALRLRVDNAARAREEERRRFAAHLHDSVLQTLALIQRQATDPEAVAKLARRQEHALRAWMAGAVDLSSATLAGAVTEMVHELEDEQKITVELTAIGDAELGAGGEALVAAGREALRNVGRHAPGAAVNVFLDAGRGRVEMFIRDDGPGFDFAAVPPERRGLRDAVIGRMALVGGAATVDSTPGQGTEIALRLPRDGRQH